MSIQGGDIVSNLRLLGRRHLEGFEIGRARMITLGRKRFDFWDGERKEESRGCVGENKSGCGARRGCWCLSSASGVIYCLRCLPRLTQSSLVPR